MKGWRVFFAIAAAYNLLVGLPMLVAPAFAYAAGGMPSPVSLIEPRFGGLCVMTFGLGYAFVALRPERNVDLVRMGLVSKLAAFCLMFTAWRAGEASATFLQLAVGDLLWASGFAGFLLGVRRRAA